MRCLLLESHSKATLQHISNTSGETVHSKLKAPACVEQCFSVLLVTWPLCCLRWCDGDVDTAPSLLQISHHQTPINPVMLFEMNLAVLIMMPLVARRA